MKNIGKYIVLLLALLVFAGEAGAKSRSGGSFKSSSFKSTPSTPSKSSSWFGSKSTPSSFKSTPTSTPQVQKAPVTPPSAPVQVNKSQSSSFKTTTAVGAVVATATTPTTNTPKTTNAIDAKLAKNTSVGGKTFATKSDAESAYRTKLASQNTYTSSREPSTRPNYVPRNVSVGGRNVNVVYHQYGSGYGYGYYDPMTHAFVALAATQMMVNASRQAEIDEMYYREARLHEAQMRQAQLASQPVVVQQPVHQSSSSNVVLWIIIGILVICIIIGLAYFLL
jgi:hypothetical protein